MATNSRIHPLPVLDLGKVSTYRRDLVYSVDVPREASIIYRSATSTRLGAFVNLPTQGRPLQRGQLPVNVIAVYELDNRFALTEQLWGPSRGRGIVPYGDQPEDIYVALSVPESLHVPKQPEPHTFVETAKAYLVKGEMPLTVKQELLGLFDGELTEIRAQRGVNHLFSWDEEFISDARKFTPLFNTIAQMW
ncbi:MAG: hypothetical protein HYS53_00180 [Candidatus Aenigmarchaeota archaeon]|nr:hypothetical protein [Candidatus Aenigmarchaeota archaeon]